MLLAGVGLAAKKLRHAPPQQIEVQAEVQTEMRAEVRAEVRRAAPVHCAALGAAGAVKEPTLLGILIGTHKCDAFVHMHHGFVTP